jgi:transposase
LTTDEGGIAPHALLVQALVHPLRVTLEAIETGENAIAQRAQRPPDFPLFQARPGAGPVCAPRLLVACGDQRERSACAAALQKYAGIAPVTERSGKKSWGHWRRQCPQCLRHTFVEWAAESIRHACWARVYSQPQRDQGTAPQAAVRALAFTWSRLLFRCWPDRTSSEESVSLQALNRRGSSLIQHLAKEA